MIPTQWSVFYKRFFHFHPIQRGVETLLKQKSGNNSLLSCSQYFVHVQGFWLQYYISTFAIILMLTILSLFCFDIFSLNNNMKDCKCCEAVYLILFYMTGHLWTLITLFVSFKCLYHFIFWSNFYCKETYAFSLYTFGFGNFPPTFNVFFKCSLLWKAVHPLTICYGSNIALVKDVTRYIRARSNHGCVKLYSLWFF